eukprot:10210883-Alexandrium_andersonii.AAC.1
MSSSGRGGMWWGYGGSCDVVVMGALSMVVMVSASVPCVVFCRCARNGRWWWCVVEFVGVVNVRCGVVVLVVGVGIVVGWRGGFLCEWIVGIEVWRVGVFRVGEFGCVVKHPVDVGCDVCQPRGVVLECVGLGEFAAMARMEDMEVEVAVASERLGKLVIDTVLPIWVYEWVSRMVVLSWGM